jgi:antitoxin Phd
MASWQVQEAKARLSELIDKARTEGPQTITKHGVDAAVVVSMEEYKRLLPKKTLVQFLLEEGPTFPDDFDLERDKSPPRDVSLDD